MKIRPFQDSDAVSLASAISRSLLEVNSKDYPAREIQAKVDEYSPANLLRLAETKKVFVADDEGLPVGVAMLRGDEISGVFVAPNKVRQGIGRRLMTAVEERAMQDGCASVHLSSSVTARTFYQAIGYKDVSRDKSNILMKKQLI